MNIKEKLEHFFRPIDLTKSNIFRSILIFSFPILIYLILQQVYAITDASISGHNLTHNEVAGINDAMCLTYFFTDFGFGASSGFSSITAEAFGEKNLEKVRKSFVIQIVIMVISGVILTIVALVGLETFLSLINLDSSNPVFQYAYDYLFIFFLGIIPVFLYNTCNNVLRAVGDSVTSVIILFISIILNIILDLLFIVVFKWGVRGAAFATVISQIVSVILCFAYIYKKYSFLKIKLSDFKLNLKYTCKHIRNGIPLGLEFSLLCIGIIIMQGAVVNIDILNNSISNAAQLGYGCANKTLGILFTVPNALSATMLAFVGQNLGAKEYDRIRKGYKVGFAITITGCLILSAIVLLLCINGTFVRIYLNEDIINDDIIKYATYYYFVNGPIFFSVGLLCIQRNSLQGLQKPLIPFIGGILELIIRVLFSLYITKLVDPANPASDKAFLFLMFGDGATWLLNALFQTYATHKYFILKPRNNEIK